MLSRMASSVYVYRLKEPVVFPLFLYFHSIVNLYDEAPDTEESNRPTRFVRNTDKTAEMTKHSS